MPFIVLGIPHCAQPSAFEMRVFARRSRDLVSKPELRSFAINPVYDVSW